MKKFVNFILKNRISPIYYLNIVIQKIIIAFFGILFRILPLGISISIMMQNNFYKQLDYDKIEIMMKINSLNQIYRTNGCKKEPETVRWIEKYIKPDEVFFDIGANVGAYSLICYAHKEGRCQIFSFEPSFSTFSALCENIIFNGYSDKTIAVPVIISDVTNFNKFYYSDISPGAANHSVNLKNNQIYKSRIQSIHNGLYLYNYVASFRLDDFISIFQIPKPNHIKIDVDGHELKVIKGCVNVLDSDELKSILIEIDKTNNDYLKIIDILKRKNFKIASIHPHGDGTIISNYIFVKSE